VVLFSFFFCEIVELHVTKAEKADLRSKLKKTGRKRSMAGKDDTQNELQKVSSELKELRQEIKKLREEAVAKVTEESFEEGYELGFDKEKFLALNPTKSLQWVTTTLAVKMKEEVAKYPSYFGPIQLLGRSGSEMVVWTCAGFNRGGNCQARWHIHDKPSARVPERVHREMRLHCCTLCYDGLGILSEHRLLDCPWIKKSTWYEIRGGPPDMTSKEEEEME
jgi:hypothetical protein